jgi:hypothetical protein
MVMVLLLLLLRWLLMVWVGILCRRMGRVIHGLLIVVIVVIILWRHYHHHHLSRAGT